MIADIGARPGKPVLGRLQELGIMLGSAGSSLLENSMEDSLSLEDSTQVNSAEMTLAVFFLQGRVRIYHIFSSFFFNFFLLFL